MQPRFGPPSARSRGVFLILVASIIMGIIGGMIGVTIVVRSGAARSSLGLTDNIDGLLQNSPTRTDKIVLEESSAVIDAVKKVSPSVVSITITKDVQDFFGQVLTQKGGGTGFIISSDGLIATNKHVVSDAGATYSVFTATGKEYSARSPSAKPRERRKSALNKVPIPFMTPSTIFTSVERVRPRVIVTPQSAPFALRRLFGSH